MNKKKKIQNMNEGSLILNYIIVWGSTNYITWLWFIFKSDKNLIFEGYFDLRIVYMLSNYIKAPGGNITSVLLDLVSETHNPCAFFDVRLPWL